MQVPDAEGNPAPASAETPRIRAHGRACQDAAGEGECYPTARGFYVGSQESMLMGRPEIVYVGDGESSPHVKEAKELIAEDYDKVRDGLARFSANTRWVTKNRDALKEDYGDMYIAVLDEKVCASHADLSGLLEEIDGMDVDTSDAFIDRIEKHKRALLFWAVCEHAAGCKRRSERA